jgi:S-(hydroxymethyl)glutathione dehydrogenase/alcohol dehydrogenase
VAVGDHVVLTPNPPCGLCYGCVHGEPGTCVNTMGVLAFALPDGSTHLHRGDQVVYRGLGVAAFADQVITQETGAVKIPDDVPLDVACLIGCAVVTGAGAVLNRAKVQPGETVAVIGAGGIGQSVIQAAHLSAAGRIVVIDANPGKEAVARQFGATDFLDGSTLTGDGELVQAVKDLGLPDGVDHAFECVGHPTLIRNAIDLLDWGGQCILLGVPKLGTEASFVVNTLYNDKSIMGCRYGSTRPHHDIPMYVQFYLDGRMPLGEMVSQTYDLADINAALEDLHAGKLNRGVLVL